MSKRADLVGARFGKLEVLSYYGANKDGDAVWKCWCDCGNISHVRTGALKSGNTTKCISCGPKIHGMSRTKLYKVWQGMKTRCNNSNAINYRYYGGRGISYDPTWEIFLNFYKDMKDKYKKGLSLERKNNGLGYSKNNCEWTTPKQQSKNMRTNVQIKYKGKYLMPEALSMMIGLLPTTIYNRKRRGWSDSKIINTPAMTQFANKKI